MEDEEYDPIEIINRASDNIQINLRLEAMKFVIKSGLQHGSSLEMVRAADLFYRWLLNGDYKALDRISE